jgi:hypothetical protein
VFGGEGRDVLDSVPAAMEYQESEISAAIFFELCP